jgi:xanthine dehydrogenase accessory factor
VSQLRTAGFAEARVAKLVCPIGAPGIAGKEPAVIGAAVAAHLLMARSAS